MSIRRVHLRRSWPRPALLVLVLVTMGVLLFTACSDENSQTLAADDYRNKVHGAWVTIMVANHSGLPIEGIWIDEPGPGDTIDLVLLDEWSTDDDTHVEWLDLHIMETWGIEPTYEQIRDEWVDHLNGDIWVSTRQARLLMDDGVVPPETSNPRLNPDGLWSIDAQLETELFGLIAPGLPLEARRRAEKFARVTNSGSAVAASSFYAHMYAEAFFETDVAALVASALALSADESTTSGRESLGQDPLIVQIVQDVTGWSTANPDDWRVTRELIREKYDNAPAFWGSQVNFAATIMALLYGDGDLSATMNIAGLAGWDNDNNMTTAAGLIGVIVGFDDLPEPYASATDIYFNQDLSGDLPQYDSVANIAERTAAIGDLVVASVE